MTDEPEAPVARDGAKRYRLLPDRVLVDDDRGRREIPLGDAADPAFLHLPRVDLDDGRALRRAAFDAWASNVRAAAALGREFETAYRAPRPIATGLAITGAVVVSGLCALLLLSWAWRPERAVDVRPSTFDSFLLLVAVAAVVGIIVVSVAALLRAWHCRRGSWIAIGSRGVRTVKGGLSEPLTALAAAEYHALLRCTRIAFSDGRPDLWVPAEPGVLRRIDLLLAAMDERLGAALREKL